MSNMFKISVLSVHGLILILATFIGLIAVYNPSPPELGRTYEVWFTAIAIFDILVIISVLIQLKVKNVWVFIATVLGLVILFYYLPLIVFYIENML